MTGDDSMQEASIQNIEKLSEVQNEKPNFKCRDVFVKISAAGHGLIQSEIEL